MGVLATTGNSVALSRWLRGGCARRGLRRRDGLEMTALSRARCRASCAMAALSPARGSDRYAVAALSPATVDSTSRVGFRLTTLAVQQNSAAAFFPERARRCVYLHV